jgi:hypothetical protein
MVSTSPRHGSHSGSINANPNSKYRMPPPDRISQTPQPQQSRPLHSHLARPASVMPQRMNGIGRTGQASYGMGETAGPMRPPFVEQLRENGGGTPWQGEYPSLCHWILLIYEFIAPRGSMLPPPIPPRRM